MIRFFKKASLLIFFMLSLFFMEIILRLSVTEGFSSSGLLVSLLFSTSFATAFYVISTLFKNKINVFLSFILLILSAFIFSSQALYYKIFKTFYSLYSAGNAGQAFEFYKVALDTLSQNYIWIILFLLPGLLLILGRKFLCFDKPSWSYRAIVILLIIISHGGGLGAVYLGGNSQSSAYDLYYNSSVPALSVQKLGLITTMRLDLQRTALGWAPSFEPPVSEWPVLSPGQSEEEPIDQEKEYNMMNIDFDKLIAGETNEEIQDMHKFFQSVQPTLKNEYTGKYKDYNLILITAEAFAPYGVREDVTPTLYKMVNEGYNFTNFYTPLWGVSTTDGEYVALNSLIPKSGIWSFKESANNYLPFVMGNQFKELGYKTVAYHNHTYSYYGRNLTHPNMGYEYKGVGNGLNIKKTWPASDLEMMEVTVPEYINDQPFHAYYMTVSGHLQYNFFGNSIAAKNQDLVNDLPYSKAAKAYLATQIELDKALEHLLNKLEEAGIADKTLIALSADHYPYGLEDKTIEELTGEEVEKNFDLHKNGFILYTKGMEPVTIDRPSSSLDIIPTLSNLLGLEYDSRLLMGRDIFSKAEPIIPFANRSFITDKGRFNAETGEFIPVEGIEIDEDYIDRISSIVNAKFYYSTKILENDYYRKVLSE